MKSIDHTEHDVPTALTSSSLAADLAWNELKLSLALFSVCLGQIANAPIRSNHHPSIMDIRLVAELVA